MSKGTIMLVALGLLCALNLFSYFLMGRDKAHAKRSEWRIPERTLFLAAGCFGALGALIGMHRFRHKTKHWYFRLGFPVMLALQVVLLVGAWCLLN